MTVRFADLTAMPPAPIRSWAPLVVKRARIAAEIERLADLPRPADGIRAARIIHPDAPTGAIGLAPDIDIVVTVLKPGERSAPIRHNSAQISLCIGGRGQVRIGAESLSVGRHDVWNKPAMHPYSYHNDDDELFVRLSYSNAALLEQMRMHYVEHMPEGGFRLGDVTDKQAQVQEARALAKPIPLAGGAELLTYEHLIAPEVVPNRSLIWRWDDIARHRDEVFPVDALKDLGRRGLFVLYNPATGRTVGMTHNFFATVGFMPKDVLDFPHRHSSNAINYALDGDFVSEVDGVRYEWSAGDIAYTAPSWTAHANGSKNGGTALTVQDHPFQIATECLVWQEGADKPVLLLGAQQGFASDDAVQLASAG